MEWMLEQPCPYEMAGEGIVIDWVDHQFVILIKDQKWSEVEIMNFKRNKMQLDFVKHDNISLFLITVAECIETSDLPFTPHESEFDFSHAPSSVEVVALLINADNIVIAKKMMQLDAAATAIIMKELKRQQEESWDEALYNQTLDQFQAKYEPFEMEPFVVVSKVVK